MATPATKLGTSASRKGVLKMTKSGRPLLRNLLDIYAALVLALPLHLTYRWFTKYHDAFTVDDAVHFLANLTITHCLAGSENRARDGRTATVTTTATAVKTKAVTAVKTKTVATVKTKTVAAVKTTTYCFPQEMSRRLCQMFMEARLIASITDPRSREFSNSGVYALTPKGLHVVEQFMAKNGLAKDIIARLLATQPVCKRLLHVVRRWDEDEVIISESVVHSVFRRFVGQAPNRTSADLGVSDPLHKYEQHSKGILLTEAPSKASGVGLNDSFKAFDAIDWLLDFTSLANEDEAGTMLAHFVRLGLIVLVRDKRRFGVSVKVYTAQVEDSPDAAAQERGTFRASANAIYQVTEDGRRVAGWDDLAGAGKLRQLQPAANDGERHTLVMKSGYSTPSALPNSDEDQGGGVYVTTRESCGASGVKAK